MSQEKKGYHLFDLDTQASLISKEVKFFDTLFPFLPSPDTSSPIPLPADSFFLDYLLDESSASLSIEAPNISQHDHTPFSAPDSLHSPQLSSPESYPADHIPPPASRMEQRIRTKPAWLKDFVS